jgi:hypothetical protein
MSDVYNAYEAEYLELIASIRKNLDNLKGSDNNAANATWIKEIDNLSRDVADRLKNMDFEIRLFDSNTRKVYTTRVMEYRSSYNALQSEYQSTKEQKQRSGIIDKDSQAQRQRMLTVNDK